MTRTTITRNKVSHLKKHDLSIYCKEHNEATIRSKHWPKQAVCPDLLQQVGGHVAIFVDVGVYGDMSALQEALNFPHQRRRLVGVQVLLDGRLGALERLWAEV